MRIEKKLTEMGIDLPEIEVDTKRVLVSGVKIGNLLFCSGSGPWADPAKTWEGKVGSEFDTKQAYEAARWCGVGLLAQVKLIIGDLDRIKRVVKVLGMVNATDDFEEQPQVVNGASDLFVELLGEMGKHARSAVGMSSLPGGQPVEVEAIFEIE